MNERLKVIRDRVRGAAAKEQCGLYLYGRPGTGKTYTVTKTLRDYGHKFVLFPGHLTDMGLFELLKENSESTIVLDDVTVIFKHHLAMQMLLAALGQGSEDRNYRLVKYRRKGMEETIKFSGSVIALSNLELHGDEVMSALKSRVQVINYNPTGEQMEALIRDVASKGWRGLMSTDECTEVAEFLIAESHRLKVRLDMRNLVDKAFPDFIQWRRGDTEADWKDLVVSTLQESLVRLEHTPGADEKVKQQEIVKNICMAHPDRTSRISEWAKQTGKSQATFYRIAKQLGLLA